VDFGARSWNLKNFENPLPLPKLKNGIAFAVSQKYFLAGH